MRIPPGFVALAGGLAIWAIARSVPQSRVVVPGSRGIAVGLGIAGVALMALGVAAFLRARTSVDPLHPEKASTLVVTGIYRITRNPMYLGFAAILLALTFRLSVWPGLLIVARFGDAAREYRRAVRRWI